MIIHLAAVQSYDSAEKNSTYAQRYGNGSALAVT